MISEKGLFSTVLYVLVKALTFLGIRILRPFFPVDDRKILFLTFSGNYDCNPKAICSEIIRQGLDLKLVWGVYELPKKEDSSFPDQVKPVKRNSVSFYKEISSAKIIVDNAINMATLKYPKKKNQILIQTWHGSLGMKKIGAASNRDKRWVYLAETEARQTDAILSNSTFDNHFFRESFWKETMIWEFGHPRNDIFFLKDEKEKKDIEQKLRKWFGISGDTKICLYAPTFRDDGDLKPYALSYQKLIDALQEKFGGKWVVLVRFHFRTRSIPGSCKLPDIVKDAGDYPDIQELLTAADVGITDYSSWICDYVHSRRPAFVYAADLHRYAEKDRGLILPIHEFPFPASADEQELVDSIRGFDEQKYKNACDSFLDKMGCWDDGCASVKTVEEIKKKLCG
ncbi:MAG: CDP-glycerol glycerophosphotransferase family protein [Eubacterium sp.]|nr:CDP-glycerol glycerophosphotransferase family protein [Eubacterium sp.]